MRNRIGKLLSAFVAAVILLSSTGCTEEKSAPRTIQDKDVRKDDGKPGGAR